VVIVASLKTEERSQHPNNVTERNEAVSSSSEDDINDE
jgi:hypothetical protein